MAVSFCTWTLYIETFGDQEMRKEVDMMLIIVVCAILGVVTAVIVNLLYTNGIIFDELITDSITIDDAMFIVFLIWVIVGIIIGVFKD